MIVAAVSGGLDSVGLLWRLLEGHEPVHVHHVSMRTVKTRRGQSEDSAMRSIVPWLRDRKGSFGYTESVYRPGRDPGGYDVVIVTRHVAETCKRLGLVPSAYCRGGALHDEAAKGIAKRRARAAQEWSRCWPKGKAPPIEFPLSSMSRAEIWAMLPDELRMLTTSCRKPVVDGGQWRACGACAPCRQMAREDVPLERTVAL